MTDAIDFDTLDTAAASEKTFEFELVHPGTKKPLGVFLGVIGPESKAFKDRVRREVNRDRRKAFEATRKNKGAVEPNTIEEDEASGVSMIADLVKSWRTVTDGKSENVIIWKGEKLPFTSDNLTRWLANFQWVIPQINDVTNEIGNFLGN